MRYRNCCLPSPSRTSRSRARVPPVTRGTRVQLLLIWAAPSSRPTSRRASTACPGAASIARRRGARHHLDPGRARGHAGGRAVRRPQGRARAASEQRADRRCRQRLSGRGGARARCSSAGSPTGSAARSCSSSPSRLYLAATAATALSWDFWSFALFRFLTGAGIGGEYTAINSAIQELIPARYRGWTDLAINGSFWVGAALGAVGSIVLLDPAVIAAGHRLAARVPDRRGARARHLRHAAVDSREPALADDPRRIGEARRRGRARSRSAVRRVAGARRRGCRRCGCARARTRRSARWRATLFTHLSAAHPGRADADGGAGVLLQRDLLHLCADPDRFLRRAGRRASAGTSCRSRPAISSARWCSAGCSTRSAARR